MAIKELIYKKICKSKPEVTFEEISNIIDALNIDEIEQELKKRYVLEIWDKKSPINGIDAETILKSRKYNVNSAYLIYIDNKIVFFQDHNPEKEGYIEMTKKEAKKIGENFIDKKIEENFIMNIYDKVFNIINRREEK